MSWCSGRSNEAAAAIQPHIVERLITTPWRAKMCSRRYSGR
jgi:hypothetical protein